MNVLRAVIASMILLGSLAMSSGVALAGRDWCDDDPIFHWRGGAFHVTTTWRNDSPVSSIAYVLDVPSNVDVSVVIPSAPSVPTTATVSATLPAWNGKGEVPVVLHTTVSAGGSYHVSIKVNGTTRADDRGKTNETIDTELKMGHGKDGHGK